MQLIDKDICGSWKPYPVRLKKGWLYPCYRCDGLTARNSVCYGYTLWGCKECLPRLTEEHAKAVLTGTRLGRSLKIAWQRGSDVINPFLL